MGERLPCKQEARGSIPLISTSPFFENRIEKKARKNKVLLPERAVDNNCTPRLSCESKRSR